jgi:hypothetical protein
MPHPTIQFLLDNLEGLFDDLDLVAIAYSMSAEQIVQDTLRGRLLDKPKQEKGAATCARSVRPRRSVRR